MIPDRLALFRFPGFGPDLSHGIAALTQDRRLVITDAATNQGTSVTNALEIAIPAAKSALEIEDDVAVYQWTPNDPLKPTSVWEVVSWTSGDVRWVEQTGWDDDVQLRGAIDALRKAGAASTTR